MAYTKYQSDWKNDAAGGTPIVEAALDQMETGIYDAHVTADAAIAKSVGTTAGDIIYFTASGTPARLGIGTARQALLTNSGATAPSWGASMQSLMTATGDTVYASAANTPARLAIGSTGQVLTVAAGLPSWATAFSISTQSNQLSGDVTIASANTFYDGPSLSLAAGTWLLVGTVTLTSVGGSVKHTAKLWDGTTVTSSAQTGVGAGTTGGILSLCGTVAPGSTTTYKISVASDTGSSDGKIVAAAPVNGAGNNASTLVAVKIA